MLPIGMRRFMGNIVGGFVANRSRRQRVRVWVSAPMWRCVRFVRHLHPEMHNRNIQRFYGAGGKSLVLGVGNQYVYKFSCMRNANKIALRENDIVNTFCKISPLYTPDIKILHDGKNIVRRYDFVRGVALSDLSPDTIIKNADNLGYQIAEFLYKIGISDPDNLKQYKEHSNDIPRMFYGWNHMDFDNLENFLVNTDTLKIIAVIDWENAQFGDFYNRLYRTGRPEKRALFDVVVREYTKMYNKNLKAAK